MTLSGVEIKASELTVPINGVAADSEVFLFVCKSPVTKVERESEEVGSETGLTIFIYHGVKMRMTAIKAKAKRVLRSIYL